MRQIKEFSLILICHDNGATLVANIANEFYDCGSLEIVRGRP